jgi:hypothetical protein
MSLDYKNYKSEGNAVSSDSDAVGNLMDNGIITEVKAPTEAQLFLAMDWLSTYQVMDDMRVAQDIANVIAFLDLTVQSKNKRKVLSEAKRQYAATHGIKVSQVKLKK